MGLLDAGQESDNYSEFDIYAGDLNNYCTPPDPDDEDDDEEDEWSCDEFETWHSTSFPGEMIYGGFDLGTIAGFCGYCDDNIVFSDYYPDQCACCGNLDLSITYSCLAGPLGPECQEVYDGTGDFATIAACEAAGCGPTDEDPCIAFDGADLSNQQAMCNLYFQWAWYGDNPGNFDDTTLEAFANITNNGECCPEEMTPDEPEPEVSPEPEVTPIVTPPIDVDTDPEVNRMRTLAGLNDKNKEKNDRYTDKTN